MTTWMTTHSKPLLVGAIVTLVVFSGGLMDHPTAQAESLFRGSVSHTDVDRGYRPSSWFAQPLPHAVGDTLTININETQTMKNSASLATSRTQTVAANSSNIINNIIHKLGVPNNLSFPNLNGVSNDNALDSSAEALRTSQLIDKMTVQVVQILPNGNLVVQGVKTTLINKDTVNMQVTGIVNPYYLNNNNEIASAHVGNFQLLMGGQGVITRQSNDGLYNKIFSWFH